MVEKAKATKQELKQEGVIPVVDSVGSNTRPMTWPDKGADFQEREL